jgi:hypothetical protein
MFISLSIEEARNSILINIDHIASINGPVVKMSNQDIITLKADSLHELLMVVAPKEKQIKNKNPKKELLELFERLHKLTGGKGKTVFSLGREQKLTELLTKHRMTPELLTTAATNIGNNAFLQGENDSKTRYGNIDYLLRPDKAAKWSEVMIEKKKSMF